MKERIKGASGKEYEAVDVTKLQEKKYEDMTEQIKAWGQGLKQGKAEAEKDLKIQKLQAEVDAKDRTVKHLLDLIETFGFCKPEMQLGRMDLREAQDVWMEGRGVDEKNLGAFAKSVLRDMMKLGEL